MDASDDRSLRDQNQMVMKSRYTWLWVVGAAFVTAFLIYGFFLLLQPASRDIIAALILLGLAGFAGYCSVRDATTVVTLGEDSITRRSWIGYQRMEFTQIKTVLVETYTWPYLRVYGDDGHQIILFHEQMFRGKQLVAALVSRVRAARSDVVVNERATRLVARYPAER